MNVCGICGGVVGPWLEFQVNDPEAYDCACGREPNDAIAGRIS